MAEGVRKFTQKKTPRQQQTILGSSLCQVLSSRGNPFFLKESLPPALVRHELVLPPSYAASWLLQKFTLSWPETGQTLMNLVLQQKTID